MKAVTPVVAGMATFATAMSSATAYLAMNEWFGVGDLTAMAYWSVTGAGTVGILAPLALLPRSQRVRYGAALVLGIGIGVLWCAGAVAVLGGWIGAFSFPVLFCWIAASVIGFIVAIWVESPRTWKIAIALIGLTAAATGRGFLYAMAPPPRVVLHFKPDITEAEIDTVWTKVLGEPHASGVGHDVRTPISSVYRDELGHEVTLVVSFSKGQTAARNRLLDEIARSPLIARIELVDPAKPTTVRTSVDY